MRERERIRGEHAEQVRGGAFVNITKTELGEITYSND